MIYQQCGPLCPQTCDNLDQLCEGGCAEGCFCPEERKLLDQVCVEAFQCTGKYELKHFNKAKISMYGTSFIIYFI